MSLFPPASAVAAGSAGGSNGDHHHHHHHHMADPASAVSSFSPHSQIQDVKPNILHPSQSPTTASSTSPPSDFKPATASVSDNVITKTTSNTSSTSATLPLNPKPKQKRNKPTLSCWECVERKTKCDRGRPSCLACVKRSSKCEYSHVANLLASSDGSTRPGKIRKQSQVQTPTAAKSPSATGKFQLPSLHHQQQQQSGAVSSPVTPHTPGFVPTFQIPTPTIEPNPFANIPTVLPPRRDFPGYSTKTHVRLSSLAGDKSAISVFGLGQEHPFGNYWTNNGGLKEVVAVLPTKEQADILVSKYFECIDPLYPLLDRESFIISYNSFWTASKDEQDSYDPSIVALHFVVYANATLFMEMGRHPELAKTAEFYISAAHQALRISSYWSHISLTTIQAMVMTFHFLINNNHVQDAWVFSGIATRQSYVLQLNRCPLKVEPNSPPEYKALRLITWSMIMTQDSGISLFLKLPPSAFINDVNVESFNEVYRQIDVASIPNPSVDYHPITPQSGESRKLDLFHLRCIWQMAVFVQVNICLPRSLDQPICRSNDHKRQLVDEYRTMWRNFPPPFNSYNPNRFMQPDLRLAKQLMGLANIFYHPMMLIQAETNPAAGVAIDVYGTLESGHEALLGFFAMMDVFGHEVNGFWSLQHRAFEVALTMAKIMAGISALPHPPDPSNTTAVQSPQYLLQTAKEDVRRMLDVIRISSGYFEYQSMEKSRLDVLREVYQKITIS